MTRTGPADVAMSACAHAATGRPVVARPGFGELVCVWPASGEPTLVRAVFPRSASFKPASCRSRRSQEDCPAPSRRPVRAPGPPCPRRSVPAYPLYFYLLEWPAAAQPGCSIDPGRDVLCILTSPPRWLQWP
jgi:hypothetical protein